MDSKSQSDKKLVEYSAKCKLGSTSQIDLRVDFGSKTISLDNMTIDYQEPKLFFILLNATMKKFHRMDFERVYQSVALDDWNNFLSKNDKWKRETHVGQNPDTIIISCKIDDCATNIGKSLGF
jgi:hypothetical protein